MKDRALTLALAVAAFALFYSLFFPSRSPVDRPTRPVSTEQGPNGYFVMQRWLASQRVPLQLLRDRFDKLSMPGAVDANTSFSQTGNLLITTMPHILPLRSSEEAALRRWVEGGNTLLVLAGLADTPEWSMGEGYDPATIPHLELITGMRFAQVNADAAATEGTDATHNNEKNHSDSSVPPAEGGEKVPKKPRRVVPVAAERFDTPARYELVPNGRHPLLDGVHSVVALSEYPSEQFRAEPVSVGVVLELARDREAGEPVLWLAQRGRGQVIVSGFGSLFTNRLLAQSGSEGADNAQLLANIVSQSLRDGGRVIIDDTHQGGVSFYDAAAFFKDARLHRTLYWLVALWLVFILGPQRLRATASSWQPVDITTFVRSTGGFLARVVRPSAAAQQLFDNFFRDVRDRELQPDSAADWDWLASHAAVPAADLRQLRDLHDRALQGRRVDLPRLHNLLTRIRRTLA